MNTDFELKKHIKDVLDFPKPGIIFRDIMPLLANPDYFKNTLLSLSDRADGFFFDSIVGIESRGFLLASPLAFFLNKSFVAARKKGKLPGEVYTETYSLEYGNDCIEMQKSSIKKNSSYIIVDDVIATGGTALATANIIKKNGGQIVGFIFLIELIDLKGRDLLFKHFPSVPVESVVVY